MVREYKQLDNSWGKYSTEVVAKPVDTYVSPARPIQEHSKYKQLAAALAGFHTPLNAYLKTKHDEQVTADEALGKKMYMQDGAGLSWADYRDTRDVARKNEAVKRGFLLARASNDAALLERTLKEAYLKGEAQVTLPNGETVHVSNSDDPAAFERWTTQYVNQFIEQNMGKETPADVFAGVFMPQVEESMRSLSGFHLQQRQERLMAQAEGELSGLVQNVIAESIAEGQLSSPEGATQLVTKMNNLLKASDMMFMSMDSKLALIEKTFSHFLDMDNIEDIDALLYAMHSIEVMPGMALSNYAPTMHRLNRVLDQRNERIRVKEEREEAQRKKEEREARDVIFADILIKVQGGWKPSRTELVTQFKAMPGITSDEISQLVGRVEQLIDYRKEPKDYFWISRALASQEDERRYQFMRRHQEGFSYEDIEADRSLTPDDRFYFASRLGTEGSRRNTYSDTFAIQGVREGEDRNSPECMNRFLVSKERFDHEWEQILEENKRNGVEWSPKEKEKERVLLERKCAQESLLIADKHYKAMLDNKKLDYAEAQTQNNLERIFRQKETRTFINKFLAGDPNATPEKLNQWLVGLSNQLGRTIAIAEVEKIIGCKLVWGTPAPAPKKIFRAPTPHNSNKGGAASSGGIGTR